MRNTLTTLNNMKQSGDKIAMLTCYDASFAALSTRRCRYLLVGDSLGMVCQGHEIDAAGESVADVQYHTGCVASGDRSVHCSWPTCRSDLSR